MTYSTCCSLLEFLALDLEWLSSCLLETWGCHSPASNKKTKRGSLLPKDSGQSGHCLPSLPLPWPVDGVVENGLFSPALKRLWRPSYQSPKMSNGRGSQPPFSGLIWATEKNPPMARPRGSGFDESDGTRPEVAVLRQQRRQWVVRRWTHWHHVGSNTAQKEKTLGFLKVFLSYGLGFGLVFGP